MAGQLRRMLDYNRWMAGTTNDNVSTKLDNHRSRVPGATDIASTFHSKETLVHAVTLAPGASTGTFYINDVARE